MAKKEICKYCNSPYLEALEDAKKELKKTKRLLKTATHKINKLKLQKNKLLKEKKAKARVTKTNVAGFFNR
ncbi:MAG: hypothetical protein A3F17_07320 [Gammaproteobacteria bacterium RIFCSPHIGHO2_12_FULL_41_15]|nr:MAG: hypothetical protein A3F17_07320 [Gammaproteobacteria bacterium RIFCSPHIGHO2_12_FULL_41_15]